jgi:hypothetical protein
MAASIFDFRTIGLPYLLLDLAARLSLVACSALRGIRPGTLGDEMKGLGHSLGLEEASPVRGC